MLPGAALDIGFLYSLSEVDGIAKVMRLVCRPWAEAAAVPLARTLCHTDIEWILKHGVGRTWLAGHIQYWSGRRMRAHRRLALLAPHADLRAKVEWPTGAARLRHYRALKQLAAAGDHVGIWWMIDWFNLDRQDIQSSKVAAILLAGTGTTDVAGVGAVERLVDRFSLRVRHLCYCDARARFDREQVRCGCWRHKQWVVSHFYVACGSQAALDAYRAGDTSTATWTMRHTASGTPPDLSDNERRWIARLY